MSEILAPAGGENSAISAINAGADAIYLGLDKFSARSSAENFNIESFIKICKYAHAFGVKVYAALNTVVKNSELESFLKTCVEVWNAGADAIIIQDLFLGKFIKENKPQIRLHLSTQAGTCNVSGAVLAKEFGFERVILARETSLSDIKKICEIIETEVFVQGALCTCFSGQCYMSSFAGGNSGNRGKCKQPCRKLYSINRKGFEKLSYKLSLADLSVGERIFDLIDAGVTSFKIEGRMKSEYYLATVINAYRRCMDGGFSPVVERELLTASHRDYTTAYTLGDNHQTVNYTDSQAKGDCDYVGNVLSGGNGVAVVEMRGRFKVGDRLEVLSPTDNFGRSFVVESAATSSGEQVTDCKLVQEHYTVNCPYTLSSGDILRRRK